MYASRSAGYAGSSGTYAAPALRMPSCATTMSTARSTHSPTSAPRPIPRARSTRASRFAPASSSPYESEPAVLSIARTSGWRIMLAARY